MKSKIIYACYKPDYYNPSYKNLIYFKNEEDTIDFYKQHYIKNGDMFDNYDITNGEIFYNSKQIIKRINYEIHVLEYDEKSIINQWDDFPIYTYNKNNLDFGKINYIILDKKNNIYNLTTLFNVFSNTIDISKKYKTYDKSIINSDLNQYEIMKFNTSKYYKIEEKAKKDKTIKDKFVYFIQNPKSKEIKIGLTKDIKRRLNDIKTYFPYGIELLHIIEGNKLFEMELHEKFKNYNISGEWFEPAEEILNYISSLKGELIGNF